MRIGIAGDEILESIRLKADAIASIRSEMLEMLGTYQERPTYTLKVRKTPFRLGLRMSR